MRSADRKPTRSPQNPGAQCLATARDRLAADLAARVGADGAVASPCASRTLETALVVALLRETELNAPALRRARRHLSSRPTAHAFDRALAAAALGRPDAAAPGRALDWLVGFDHFTADRKRLLFTTVLAALDVPGFAPPDLAAEIGYRGLAPWVELLLCASRVLRLLAGGEPVDAHVAFLVRQLEHGSTKRVWQGNVLAHALALIALHRSAPGHPLVGRGVAGLLSVQNDDGGMPFIEGMNVFCTAISGIALAAAAPAAPSDGAGPSTLLAMGDFLARQQLPNGGWGYTAGVTQGDSDDTAYCLQFLGSVDPLRYAQQLDAGLTNLVQHANPDGGIPTFLPGHPSEVTMTAGAVTVLAGHPARRPEVLRAAVDFLLAEHVNGVTYERSWSRSESNSIYRVVTALRAAAPLQDARRRQEIAGAVAAATRRLAQCQRADGGWGQVPGEPSDALSTAYALLATGRGSAPSWGAGLAYLLTQQGNDGRIVSRPDQAAPRPLPYDVPVLADAFALWALGTLGPRPDAPAAGAAPSARFGEVTR
ncbi:prenyltransferase/squalene oxidase repeat-containing protein [Streptomyces sp. NPDC047315]|uniref:prenyltransferase/squalene oxidase repeat-containing protein n=1 Tax=Streptomyces sp. NPDC047315 TaxID=3155142 RepID=UPI00340F34BC